jgi:DNA-3-methyladenine glycosylase
VLLARLQKGNAILRPAFFDRPADVVARDLVGRVLVRRIDGRHVALIISETEAYLGPHDLACHAARGRTPRTEVLFAPAGTLYVYLVYGIHWMLNVVVGRPGYPAAVLIRSAGHLSGPGRLARALTITGTLNGRMVGRETGLWFERGAGSSRVLATARVGVDYAGRRWAGRKLRFVAVSCNGG